MKILITEPREFSVEALAKLEQAGFSITARQCSYSDLKKIVGNYDGLIVRLGIKIDGEILSRARRLKFVVSLTTGIDHIDVGEAEESGVQVMSLRGETEFLKTMTPTAELAVGLMLTVLRRIVPASADVQAGNWDRERWVGNSMDGRTVGIIGMGRLGKMVASIVEAFGCPVVYYDPFVFSRAWVKVNSLDEIAAMSDIVTVHVPLHKETEGMIGVSFFKRAKTGQILINTSRGAVIDEKAMLKALVDRQIAGAGLDVLNGELDGKVNDKPLVRYSREYDNLVITPHIGGATYEAMRRVEVFMIEKTIALCRSKADSGTDK